MILTTLILVTVSGQNHTVKTRPKPFELTIDGIMRGPALIGQEPRQMRWSDDGKTLTFFWKSPAEETGHSYEVNADGSHLGPAAEDQLAQGESGVTSPDGLLVAQVMGDAVVVRDRLGAVKTVTQVNEPRHDLAWTADGKALEFTSGNSEVLLALDSGDETEMVRVTPGQGAPPQIRPVSGTGRRAAGKPSGRTNPEPKGACGRAGRAVPRAYGSAWLRRQLQRPTRQPRGRHADQRSQPPTEGEPARFRFRSLAGWRSHVDTVAETTANLEARGAELHHGERLHGRHSELPKVGDVHSKSTLAITTKDGKSTWLTFRPMRSASGTSTCGKIYGPATARTLIASVETTDIKDRWLVKVDPDTGKTRPLFTEHDDAWLGGPGGGGWVGCQISSTFTWRAKRTVGRTSIPST